MKKVFSLILCIAVVLSSVFFGSFSASALGEECIITVDKLTALTGDEVMINLNIANNPGIMAMTISITYDSKALEYIDYFYGNVFTDYTVAAHPTRNLIRLVISQKKDYLGDGIIASFKFKVRDNAEFDLHEMTVDYSSGDFCNNNLERLMPTIISGGVDVQFNGSNCSHKKYSDWQEVVPPSCEDVGADKRVCEKCSHNEYRDTAPIGHDFSLSWTVDIPATKDNPGTMSRHCIRCDKVTDETNFDLDDIKSGNIKNEFDATVPENDVVSDIIAEQHPDIDFDNLSSSTSGGSSSENNASIGNNIYNNSESNSDSSADDEISDNSMNSSSDSSKNNLSNETDGDKATSVSPSDDEKYRPTEEEKKQTEDQIKEIIEIISPENVNSEENAKSIAKVLREAIPKFDKVLHTFKIAFSFVLLLVLL